MQIKTTMRDHLTSVRMVIIKKSKNNGGEGVEKKEAPLHYWLECKLVAPQWRTVWRFLKRLKVYLQNNQQSYSWRKPQFQKIYIPHYCNCGTTYNMQNMRAIPMPIDRGMDKDGHTHIYTMEYYSAMKRTKWCSWQQYRWA